MRETAPGQLAEHHFDAILFDLDGTLIDSASAVRHAWSRWASEEGVDPELLAGLAGRPAKEVVADLVPPGRVAVALARYTEIAEHQVYGVVALPGVVEALAATGERMAIVTSSSRAVAKARMAASGMSEPAVMVTAEDVARGKPEPEPYLLGAERLGVDPARCLAVEDSPVGLASARAAGCATLGVGREVSVDAADFHTTGLSNVQFLVRDGVVIARSSRPGNR